MISFSINKIKDQHRFSLLQSHWRWLRYSDIGQISLIKKGIWIYFLLWIFEGALRRWVLPSLATPLLIVRDPVAFWLLWKCWERRLLPVNIYIFLFQLIGIVAIYTAV